MSEKKMIEVNQKRIEVSRTILFPKLISTVALLLFSLRNVTYSQDLNVFQTTGNSQSQDLIVVPATNLMYEGTYKKLMYELVILLCVDK